MSEFQEKDWKAFWVGVVILIVVWLIYATGKSDGERTDHRSMSASDYHAGDGSPR